MARRLMIMLLILGLPLGARAEDRLLRLYAPEALAATGVLDYILPRFSLKTQVKVQRVADPEAADMVLGDAGRALFEGAGQVWHMALATDDADAARFADWLTSDVGQRTALAYAPDGVALFSEASKAEAEPVEVSFDGDARLGHEVSRAKCRRCHAVDEASRMSTIGSTPSFGILRSLPDWNERFAAFYLLNPHPAFMIIDGVTEPFSDQRPPPIVPIEMSLDEVEALLAYVSAMQAKDLGAPIQHQ
ncbi:MAG: hypothetical protein RID15_06970 [Marinovum algicola]|uniref:Cytochrome c domain-containing protein n=2 Tax=Roseobacteraceae TaxID=2854170 RepID=A0A975WD61_9RHOB|nr:MULTISPECIES: hypothetical protein [Marinovum]AKO99890.1 hypothetical protein MALG_04762 [Marinovum algicola DG 898]MDD9744868.1 hypothetical protein [Marinovum sp. PR37]SEJ98607.1 hypothetical protein SAMN04487940_11677 [Marinovum algicola]SLN70555.1 hypothetical protein MAA5396_03884 [Marinovum algicola]